MKKSLSLRIIVLVMIVILVTFSGLSLFIANKLNQNALDLQERRLLQSAETIADSNSFRLQRRPKTWNY